MGGLIVERGSSRLEEMKLGFMRENGEPFPSPWDDAAIWIEYLSLLSPEDAAKALKNMIDIRERAIGWDD